MSRAPALIGAMLIALVSACGDKEGSDPAVSSLDDGAPFTMTAEGEIEVSCGGDAGWPASVMATGLSGVLTDTEARSIFQSILSDPELGGEAELSLFQEGVDVDWRVLRDDGDALLLGLGDWTDTKAPWAGATTTWDWTAKTETGVQAVGVIAHCHQCSRVDIAGRR